MHRHVLVKFSPPLETPVGRRWADLLACEQLAAETLRAHGVAACETEWVEGPQRAFLEVRRFDRVGAHGRRGVVSLFAMESAYYGLLDTWSAAAERMARDGWLASDDAETLRLRWLFGQLIANADMHFANVSLLLDGERPLALAPSYDMLPMHYRPSVAGEIVARPFDPAPPPPRHRVAWSRTAGIAMDFWGRVAEDPRVSDGFRREAGRNRQAVRSVAERFAGH